MNNDDNLSDRSTDNAVVDRAERSNDYHQLVNEQGGPADDQSGVERSPGGGESESVSMLRLQLQLERETRGRQRYGGGKGARVGDEKGMDRVTSQC